MDPHKIGIDRGDVTVAPDIDSYMIVSDSLLSFKSELKFCLNVKRNLVVREKITKQMFSYEEDLDSRDFYFYTFPLGGEGSRQIHVRAKVPQDQYPHNRPLEEVVRHRFLEEIVLPSIKELPKTCSTTIYGGIFEVTEDLFAMAGQVFIFTKDWQQFSLNVDRNKGMLQSAINYSFYMANHGMLNNPKSCLGHISNLLDYEHAEHYISNIQIHYGMNVKCIDGIGGGDGGGGGGMLLPNKERMQNFFPSTETMFFYPHQLNSHSYISSRKQFILGQLDISCTTTYLPYFGIIKQLMHKNPFYLLPMFFHFEQISRVEKSFSEDYDASHLRMRLLDQYIDLLIEEPCIRIEYVLNFKNLDDFKERKEYIFNNKELDEFFLQFLDKMSLESWHNHLKTSCRKYYNNLYRNAIPNQMTVPYRHSKNQFLNLSKLIHEMLCDELKLNFFILGNSKDTCYAEFKKILLFNSIHQSNNDEKYRGAIPFLENVPPLSSKAYTDSFRFPNPDFTKLVSFFVEMTQHLSKFSVPALDLELIKDKFPQDLAEAAMTYLYIYATYAKLFCTNMYDINETFDRPSNHLSIFKIQVTEGKRNITSNDGPMYHLNISNLYPSDRILKIFLNPPTLFGKMLNQYIFNSPNITIKPLLNILIKEFMEQFPLSLIHPEENNNYAWIKIIDL